MSYQHTNSKGALYYLHMVMSPRGKKLYYFSKKLNEVRAIDLPEELTVIENSRSHLPCVKRKDKISEASSEISVAI